MFADEASVRFKCLELAKGCSKLSDDGIPVQLNADEVVEAAQKFFDFIKNGKVATNG